MALTFRPPVRPSTPWDPISGLRMPQARTLQAAAPPASIPWGSVSFGGASAPQTVPQGSVGAPGAAGIDNRGGAPGSITIGGSPGFQPNYSSILNELMAPFRAQSGAQGVSDAASRAGATQRLVAQFGEVPDFSGSGLNTSFLEQDITPETRALAERNTASGLSMRARLEREAADAKRAGINQLAARGALRSGETGYFLEQHQLQARQAQSDARTQLLDYLQGYQQAFVQAEQRRREAEQQAAMQALMAAIASNPPVAAGPPERLDYAFTNPRVGPIYGSPNLPWSYTGDGTPIIAAPPPYTVAKPPVVKRPKPPKGFGPGTVTNRYG